MAKPLEQWVEEEVRPRQNQPMSELAEYYFFRDPPRPTYSDLSYFFAPADGVILYQDVIEPDDPIVDIKGSPYSLQEAMRDESFDRRSLVLGIFMTFFDVHVNRIPYPGRLTYRALDPIDSYNHPMLDVEKSILEELRAAPNRAGYLRYNERTLNQIRSSELGDSYYLLQVADYDVDTILPFTIKQGEPYSQGERFSQIRFGSQVDLIIPMTDQFDLTPTQPVGTHVEAGLDPIVKVVRRENAEQQEAS